MGLIGLIADTIRVKENRWPLVLIDDLDKSSLGRSRQIFHDYRETMLQPHCPIVYTVSSSLFYSPEFQAIRNRAVFVPNVELHEQGQPNQRCEEGYQTMREFVYKRMLGSLIADDALEAVVRTTDGCLCSLRT